MSTELAIAAPTAALAPRTQGIQLSTLADIWDFAQIVAKSGLAPRGMESTEKIVIAMQMGLELGLSPMMALQNIGVINGKPGVYGDAALALVRQSGLLESFKEWMEGDPNSDDYAAVCAVKRRGFDLNETRFSVREAKKAQLWGKTGPWSQYPARMLKFRARGFALRDDFADVLKGFKTTEELSDYEDETASPTRRAPVATPRAAPSMEMSNSGIVAPVDDVAEGVVEELHSIPADERGEWIEKFKAALKDTPAGTASGMDTWIAAKTRNEAPTLSIFLGDALPEVAARMLERAQAYGDDRRAKKPDTPANPPAPVHAETGDAATEPQLSNVQTIARKLWPNERDAKLDAYLKEKFGPEATVFGLTKKQASDTIKDLQKQLDALANNTAPLPRDGVNLRKFHAVAKTAQLSSDEADRDGRIAAINTWLVGHGGPVQNITSTKELAGGLMLPLCAAIEDGTFDFAAAGWPLVVATEGGEA